MIILQNRKIKEHNPNWPEIPDHPYRILIIRSSASERTNALFNLKCLLNTRMIWMIFDGMIADILSKKTLQQIAT